MLLPAVQNVREAARRTQCMNNMRQIGLATQMFHDTYEAFPPARLAPIDEVAEPECVGCASWLVHILPFAEQGALYDLWDFNLSFEMQNPVAATTPIKFLICPSRRSMRTANALGELFPDGTVREDDSPGGC